MNTIEKERNKKLKEQIKNELKLVKLQAEIRKNNETKLEEEYGIEKTLWKFHEPVIQKFKDQEESRKQVVKEIQKAIESPKLPEIDYSSDAGKLMEQAEGIIRLNFNKDLDISFIKSEGFELPSELINKTDEDIDDIIEAAKRKRDSFKLKKANLSKNRNYEKDKYKKQTIQTEIDDVDYKMNAFKRYIKALSTLRAGNEYIGDGLENLLSKLDELTNKICKGSKSKKLYNRIVVLLDILLKKDILTNQQVKDYYKQFLS